LKGPSEGPLAGPLQGRCAYCRGWAAHEKLPLLMALLLALFRPFLMALFMGCLMAPDMGLEGPFEGHSQWPFELPF